MLTSNTISQNSQHLSKTDYYRSRNIPQPKPCQRLAAQPSLRNHLIEPIPSLAVQITRHISNQMDSNQIHLEYMQYEKLIHQLYEQIDQLKKKSVDQHDYIMKLENERQSSKRKQKHFEKHQFDMKSHIQKIQYEYKSTIDMLTRENSQKINEMDRRLAQKEDFLKKTEMEHAACIKSLRNTFMTKFKSFQNSKCSLKQVAQESFAKIKKELSQTYRQNTRLKQEFISAQNQHIQRIKHIQETNYRLSEEVKKVQGQKSIEVMKLSSEIQQKSFKIAELEEKIKGLELSMKSQAEKFEYEKKYILDLKAENEQSHKRNYDNLMEIKNKIMEDLNKASLQNVELFQGNQKLIDLNKGLQTKLECSNSKNTELQQHYKQKVLQLKKQSEDQRDHEVEIAKRKLTAKITELERLNEQKDNQISLLFNKSERNQTKCLNLEENIKSLHKQKCKLQAELQDSLKGNQHLEQYIQKLKVSFQTEKERYQQEIQNLNIKAQSEKIFQLEAQLRQYDQQISKLKIQAEDVNAQLKQKESHFEHQRTQALQIRKQIEFELQKSMCRIEECLSKIEDQNTLHSKEKQYLQFKNQELDCKRQEISIKLKQSEEHAKELVRQTEIAVEQRLQTKFSNNELSLKQKLTEVEQSNSQLVERINLICQNHRESMIQAKARFQERLKQVEAEKCSVVKQMIKIKGQLSINVIQSSSKEKELDELQNMYKALRNQNEKLRGSLQTREENSINTVEEIKKIYQESFENREAEFKEKSQKLETKCCSLLREVEKANSENLYNIEKLHSRDLLIQRIQATKGNLQMENETLLEKVKSQSLQIESLSKDIQNKQERISSIQAELKMTKLSNSNYLEQISKYEEDVRKMKRSQIVETDQMKRLKQKNKDLSIQAQQLERATEYLKSDLEREKSFTQKMKQTYKQSESSWTQMLEKCEAQSKLKDLRYEQRAKELEQKYLKKFQYQKRQLEEEVKDCHKKIEELTVSVQQKHRIIDENNQQSSRLIEQLRSHMMQLQYQNSFVAKQNEDMQKDIQEKEKIIEKITRNSKQKMQKETTKWKIVEEKNFELENEIKITISKHEREICKYQQIKQTLVQNDKQINRLKSELELAREELETMKKHYKNVDDYQKKYKEQFIQQINELKSSFYKQRVSYMESMRDECNVKIKDMKKIMESESTQKAELRSELHALQRSYQDMRIKYEKEIRQLQLVLMTYSKKIHFLSEYKKRWDRISGQVKQYSDLQEFDVELMRIREENLVHYQKDLDIACNDYQSDRSVFGDDYKTSRIINQQSMSQPQITQKYEISSKKNQVHQNAVFTKVVVEDRQERFQKRTEKKTEQRTTEQRSENINRQSTKEGVDSFQNSNEKMNDPFNSRNESSASQKRSTISNTNSSQKKYQQMTTPIMFKQSISMKKSTQQTPQTHYRRQGLQTNEQYTPVYLQKKFAQQVSSPKLPKLEKSSQQKIMFKQERFSTKRSAISNRYEEIDEQGKSRQETRSQKITQFEHQQQK